MRRPGDEWSSKARQVCELFERQQQRAGRPRSQGIRLRNTGSRSRAAERAMRSTYRRFCIRLGVEEETLRTPAPRDRRSVNKVSVAYRLLIPTQKGGTKMTVRSFTGLLAAALLAGCTAQSAMAGDPCFHKGTMYSTGANSCQSGQSYRCADGEWAATGVACPGGQVALSRTCQFSGISFSSGAASCQSGTQFRCEDGEWRGLGVPCSAGDSPIKLGPSGRTCMFNDATVASNSTICRSGTTYLCNDGEWTNLGTLCR